MHDWRGRKLYSTRSNAVRAARNACKKALDAPRFCAYEGPDYAIHPTAKPDEWWEDAFFYELRGPALEAALEKKNG